MVENKIPFPDQKTPSKGKKPEVVLSDDERVWAMVCHLSCLFGGLIVPALLLRMKGKNSAFIRFHALQALAYQSCVLCLMLFSLGVFFFTGPVFVLIGVMWGIRARNGEWVSYPVIRRFLPKEPKP